MHKNIAGHFDKLNAEQKTVASSRAWNINNQQDKNLLDVKGLDWLNDRWFKEFCGYYNRKANQGKSNY